MNTDVPSPAHALVSDALKTNADRLRALFYKQIAERHGKPPNHDVPFELLGEVAEVALSKAGNGEFDVERSAVAWLFGIARNVLRGYFRDHGRDAERRRDPSRFDEVPAGDLRPVDIETWTEDDLFGQLAGQDPTDSEAARLDVERFLPELPPEQARLLRDHYFEGLPLAEMAEAIGISENAMKGRLFRARGALRRLMAD